MKLPEMTSKRKILAALALVALLGGGTYVLRLGGEEKKAPEDPSVPVVLERIATHSFAETVEAQGTLRAKRFALVSPKVDGTLLEVYVREGDRVTEGQTPLFRTDDLRLREAEQRFPDEEVPRPEHWGGFRLVPDHWEFWQGRKSRLHDRLRYRQQADGNWLRERLAP